MFTNVFLYEFTLSGYIAGVANEKVIDLFAIILLIGYTVILYTKPKSDRMINYIIVGHLAPYILPVLVWLPKSLLNGQTKKRS